MYSLKFEKGQRNYFKIPPTNKSNQPTALIESYKTLYFGDTCITCVCYVDIKVLGEQFLYAHTMPEGEQN